MTSFADEGSYSCRVVGYDNKVYEDSVDITVNVPDEVIIPDTCVDQPRLAKCHLIVLTASCSLSADITR